MIKKWLLFIVLTWTAQSGLTGQNSPVLLTIAGEEVTLEEFERIYRKNNSETSLNKQAPGEYLDLFINFKLKVKEAESMGMDTTSKFIDELEGYRKQLAKPYLTDNETKEEMMKEAYERARTDINASHILIKLPPDPAPADTLAAYGKAMEIRERIASGEDFEKVARATSDDASVSRNGGNLGYFTAFSMVYPFETVAYNTPVGELSEPFRTDYGYHILQVHDKRPARGQVKVAHIFVRTPEGMSDAQREKAYSKVQMIHDSLRSGVDFAELARRQSEDPSSARNGGEMPWFGTGRMIPEFENACFSLEEKGAFSEPFKSFYGWHIVQLLDKKEVGSYEEMKPDLQDRINRGDRVKYRNDRFAARLKEEHGYTYHPGSMESVYSALDSSLLQGTWDGGALSGDDSPIMQIGERVVTTGQFVHYLEEQQGRSKSRDPQSMADLQFEKFAQEQVLDYEESMLPEKYPEFRYIYQEYHDGILLFDIMDQKVWSKAVNDTVGLEAFHREHRDQYLWDERAEAVLVECTTGADVESLRKRYKRIFRGKWDQADLNSRFCSQDSVPCITLTPLLVEEGENELVDALGQEPGLGQVMEAEDGVKFVILKEMRSPEPKSLDEARGQITSDYQNYLEKEWIEMLKQKYTVDVDRDLLSEISP